MNDRGVGGRARRAVAALGMVLAALLLGAAGPAAARHHPQRDAQPATSGVFDYYLLSLSWSPTYCLTHPGDREQCGRRGFGFVLHGLWPQYQNGGYPQFCETGESLTPEAVSFGRTIYPSPKLIDHEWSRHGVCSGLDALGYFRAADRARTSIRVPPMLEAPPSAQQVDPASIAAAVRAANPAIPEDGLVVACSRGELSEVRICLDRDLRPRACGRRVRNSCPAVPVTIPAAR
jgi:ribonuclease T2